MTDGPAAMIHLVTESYDAMKQFFVDLGLRVDKLDGGLQFTPFFNQGRGTAIYLDDMTICLEEATHTKPTGAIYFCVGDVSSECLKLVKTKYKTKSQRLLFDREETYFITPPDGGFLTATKTVEEA